MLYLCSISIFFIFNCCYANNLNYDIVKDIVLQYGKPLVPNAFVCNRTEAISFLNIMSSNRIQATVFDINSDLTLNTLPSNYILFTLDTRCRGIREFLLKANEKKLFLSPYRWLVFNCKGDNIIELFEELDIPIDSEIMIIDNITKNKTIVSNIYKTGRNTTIHKELVGYWIQENGYKNIHGSKVIAQRRNDLRGTTLISCLVITHNNSLKHLTDKRDKHIDTIAKVNYIFLLHLKDMFNITMTYTIQDSWGYQDKNGTWNGMIGELVRREADIGGTPLFLTTDRVPIIDYIAMTTPTRSKFVFRQPKLSYITNVFTLPFEDSVWLSSIALVIITSIVLFIVLKVEKNVCKKLLLSKLKSREPVEAELSNSYVDVLFLAFGAICQQGSHVIPTTMSGRVITIVLFISLMFLYTSYSANIVALLQSSSTSIQTLNDLLHSRLQVGVDDTVFNHFYFPNASEPVRKAIYEQKVAPQGQMPHFYPIDVGVSKMRQGLFAFHMETGAGYKIVAETFYEEEKCGLQEIQYLQVPDPWLAVQKNSSYKEILKIGLRRIHESGLQNREVSLLYTKKPDCTSRGSSFIGVGIVDCYPATMIFAIGIILAFIIFIFEVIFSAWADILLKMSFLCSEPYPFTD